MIGLPGSSLQVVDSSSNSKEPLSFQQGLSFSTQDSLLESKAATRAGSAVTGPELQLQHMVGLGWTTLQRLPH